MVRRERILGDLSWVLSDGQNHVVRVWRKGRQRGEALFGGLWPRLQQEEKMELGEGWIAGSLTHKPRRA